MIGGLIHSCTLQKRYRTQKMTYTGGTGTPAVGQTVTGGTSLKTAVIRNLGTGYIVAKTLSGTFTPGETISTLSWSAILGTQADYSTDEYYWKDDQVQVACKFYHSNQGGKGVVLEDPGERVDQPLKCALPPWCTINATEYRIVSTIEGFTGTFDIASFYPQSGISGIDHYETVLRKVNT